ncbi:hypothetical protein [Marinagarivorans algicola]|uniref:hypothetical protein n=1 Tax=Marinagarivorans algicola TaxID=1513270 RepID=UPI0006B4BC1A|nr:hypothetical protein [Marinagarivorans algicola]
MVTPAPAPQKHAAKYSAQYAEPLASALSNAFQPSAQRYSHTLVIPAYNESTAFIRQLMQQHFTRCSRLLVCLVINQPANKHASITRLNQRLFDFFKCDKQGFICTPVNNTHQLAMSTHRHIDFLCINSCQPGVNPKQGVGYARKLGCDVALSLMQRNIIQTGWLHCTDADATLPSTYFETPRIDENISALTYAIDHQFLPKAQGFYQKQTQQANKLYEASILYYRDGLAASGSPYAFNTIGSAIAANPKHYSQVRGFPKRAAGEDFYLLNKLAKLAPVFELTHTITLKPRASQRVPFGTGPAVKQLLNNVAFLDYNPKVFECLKIALACLPGLYERLDSIGNNNHKNSSNHKDSTALLPQGALHSATEHALKSIGIEQLLTHLSKQAKSPAQALRMSHEWFDGFKTLKFIHALSYGPYPKLELEHLPYNADQRSIIQTPSSSL